MEKECHVCGATIDDNEDYCPECGADQADAEEN